MTGSAWGRNERPRALAKFKSNCRFSSSGESFFFARQTNCWTVSTFLLLHLGDTFRFQWWWWLHSVWLILEALVLRLILLSIDHSSLHVSKALERIITSVHLWAAESSNITCLIFEWEDLLVFRESFSSSPPNKQAFLLNVNFRIFWRSFEQCLSLSHFILVTRDVVKCFPALEPFQFCHLSM